MRGTREVWWKEIIPTIAASITAGIGLFRHRTTTLPLFRDRVTSSDRGIESVIIGKEENEIWLVLLSRSKRLIEEIGELHLRGSAQNNWRIGRCERHGKRIRWRQDTRPVQNENLRSLITISKQLVDRSNHLLAIHHLGLPRPQNRYAPLLRPQYEVVSSGADRQVPGLFGPNGFSPARRHGGGIRTKRIIRGGKRRQWLCGDQRRHSPNIGEHKVLAISTRQRVEGWLIKSSGGDAALGSAQCVQLIEHPAAETLAENPDRRNSHLYRRLHNSGESCVLYPVRRQALPAYQP